MDQFSYSADDSREAIAHPHLYTDRSQFDDWIEEDRIEDDRIDDRADTESDFYSDELETLITPPLELTQPSASQEVLIKRDDRAPQRKSRIILLARQIMPKGEPRTDPYLILAAAKNKNIFLEGHRFSLKRPVMLPITQLPAKISQTKAQIAATIEQQSQRFRATVASERDQLQQFSSEQLERRRYDLDILLERVVKKPLRSVFKKIETLSHRAARQLS